MERKTQVRAGNGQQDIIITREFDLPVALLFKAYEDPEIVAQWMGTKVIKLENKKHGGYQFETSDPQGNVVFRANGVIHSFVPDKNITRTFEMENASFGAQLEFLDFEALTDDTSKLTIQSIFRSNTARDEQLKLPFAFGLNMAHDRLQEIVSILK
ncbi:SRPBCC domain-containing protein [Fulvivirgaceae bacterium PWU5]|uniref:SRPBCC domain-containing protein n=1 Tax=Dawidia cretensis TaxID=2782350 RepID=A0AAP2E3S2_9BACT|nr:SRPBCC domain-containing protein [Dawidia cretensis]MBT1711579.1 SRPBCC domain-containing protein [Dawidia cretensis]